MTEMLFDTGPLQREAILERFRKLGVKDPQPMRGRSLVSAFDRETREIITGALKEAEIYTSQAGIELAECGKYDEANDAAALTEAIRKLRARITHLLTLEEEDE